MNPNAERTMVEGMVEGLGLAFPTYTRPRR